MAQEANQPSSWSDQELIQRCLAGDELAWSVLVDRYKNLVYSVILKYGTLPDEAADLFQSVWLDAYHDLAKLRDESSVRSWLAVLARHKCFHWKRRKVRQESREVAGLNEEDLEDVVTTTPTFMEELERDQLVRDATRELTPRCQEMIRLLFFVDPPKPYREVAKELGLAIGSIGFIRGRCLEHLQKNLEKRGF